MEFIATQPQKLIVRHLATHPQALLFVGCGLGKTAACLQAIENLFIDGATKGILVVAPLRVCNLTWPSEVRRWHNFRWMRIANLRTEHGHKLLLEQAADIYLINYEMLPALADSYLFRRHSLAFDTVIWDEITRAKNHKSKRIKKVRNYFHKKLKRHWGMTGTPVPNGLLDLFAQVKLIDQGEHLGKSFHRYREGFFTPIDYDERQWELKPGAKQRIEKKIAPITLTLRSSKWLNIPDTIEHDIEIPLPKEAKKAYFELETELLTKVENNDIEASSAAVLTNKLLQVTSGAVYGEDKNKYHAIHDAKLKKIKQLVNTLTEPVIVICLYRHEQERIKKYIPNMVRWQDAKTLQQQEKMLGDWSNKKIPVLVANAKSLSHGLNLQDGGSTIIWVSPVWDREDYDQTIARVARKGQESVTTVYRVLVSGTIDYAVVEALRRKDLEQNNLLVSLENLKKIRKKP